MTTALEMRDAVMRHAGEVEILIAAAAVADHRPATCCSRKIKKNRAGNTLDLTPNPDILAEVAALPERPFTIGFAAETGDLEANARAKLKGKSLDLIAANQVNGPGTGFASADNALEVYWPGGSTHLGYKSKRLLAQELIDLIARHYHAAHPA